MSNAKVLGDPGLSEVSLLELPGISHLGALPPDVLQRYADLSEDLFEHGSGGPDKDLAERFLEVADEIALELQRSLTLQRDLAAHADVVNDAAEIANRSFEPP